MFRKLPLILLLASASAVAQTVPVGYHATARWSAVTQFVDDTPIKGTVSYKFYTIKNGSIGYQGSTPTLTWTWTVNVNQCAYVTATVYINGLPKESGHSSQVCFTVQ